MQQIERITQMEQALNRSCAALAALSKALEGYEAAKSSLAALEDYYTGPLWLADFEADEQGLIPQSLPRGVLSEDALYNLLAENSRLLEKLRELGRAAPAR